MAYLSSPASSGEGLAGARTALPREGAGRGKDCAPLGEGLTVAKIALPRGGSIYGFSFLFENGASLDGPSVRRRLYFYGQAYRPQLIM